MPMLELTFYGSRMATAVVGNFGKTGTPVVLKPALPTQIAPAAFTVTPST